MSRSFVRSQALKGAQQAWIGQVNRLEARVAELEAALRQIANGNGLYGAQAREYKEIARAALAGAKP